MRKTIKYISISALLLSLGWFAFSPGFEPVITFLFGLAGLLGSWKFSIQGDTEEKRTWRHRKAMLQLVRNTWISGVLEQSLYGGVLIELGMETRPEAVEQRSWDVALQMPKQPNRMLPTGTKMLDVFDETCGSLLILGEPGSGKTTMLLELARQAIERAEKDSTQPIPIVFNLSSWNSSQKPIEDWLVDELRNNYRVNKEISLPWVENNELMLLLDGLDEVKADYRDACVKAINDFLAQHSMVLVAICSRRADYEALTNRLMLQGVILLRPLSRQQINEYFERVGIECDTVNHISQLNDAVQELIHSPLMLHIMTLACQNIAKNLSELDSIQISEKHIFDIYIDQMFARVARTKNENYSKSQTIKWLSWLAAKMIEHGQSVFYIERLDQSWLRDKIQKQLLFRFSSLYSLLMLSYILGLPIAWLGGLIFSRSMTGVMAWYFYGFISGLIIAILIPRRKDNNFDLEFKEPKGINWEWKLFLQYFSGMLVFPSIIAIGFWWVGKPISGITFASVFLIVTFIPWQSHLGKFKIENYITPGYGINLSIKNIRMFSLQGVIVIGLTTLTAIVLNNGLLEKELPLLISPENVKVGMNFVPVFIICPYSVLLLVVLINWDEFGGEFLLLHFGCRLLLCRSGDIPCNYIAFLNNATERIFLRRVGGGYIFIHGRLMEHFASLRQKAG